jgi:hypothetical protein
MEGNPMGAVGLLNDAGQLAQLLAPEALETPIIAAGLSTLSVMSEGFGEGNPDDGQAFSDGAGQFQAVGDGLSGAYPNEWHGTGSSAYSNRNADQIGSAEQLLQADNLVVQILSTQAQQVGAGRDQMDTISTALGAMVPICFALELDIFGGTEASLVLQGISVATALAAAGVTMNTMISESSSNAAQLQRAATMYRTASEAPPLNTMPPPPTSGNKGGTGEPSSPSGPGGRSENGSGNGSCAGTGGGSSPGAGSGAGGGSGSASGAGGGSAPGAGNAPSMPSMPQTPSIPTGASTGGGMGAMPSLPQMGGGSGSGSGGGSGGGLLSSLAGIASQAVQAATQAAQQAKQQDTTAQDPNAQDPNAQDPDRDKAVDPSADTEDSEAQPGDPNHSGASAGTASQAGRAPIQVSFDDGARHVEISVVPETARGPVHVSLDPANLSAPPRITTET